MRVAKWVAKSIIKCIKLKHKLFISYSDFDKDKVSLIEKEFEGHYLFTPLVIADNRESLKPLVKKVCEGIIASSVIIPLLTHKSISTQWINQEIGFAFGMEKNIKPIVEAQIIDNLKGFIHKQVDLSYTYRSDDNKKFENTTFIAALRMLIIDLEKEFAEVTPTVPVKKSSFDEALEQIDNLNNEEQYQRDKLIFLNSAEAFENSNTEVLNMFNDLKAKIDIMKQKGLHVITEEKQAEPTFVFRAEGFSCSISWYRKYRDSTKDAVLFVKYWNGSFTLKDDGHYFAGEEPKQIMMTTYTFDRNEQLQNGWFNDAQKFVTSSNLVERCIKWFVDKVTRKRLESK